jgi:hypothetical protein
MDKETWPLYNALMQIGLWPGALSVQQSSRLVHFSALRNNGYFVRSKLENSSVLSATVRGARTRIRVILLTPKSRIHQSTGSVFQPSSSLAAVNENEADGKTVSKSIGTKSVFRFHQYFEYVLLVVLMCST